MKTKAEFDNMLTAEERFSQLSGYQDRSELAIRSDILDLMSTDARTIIEISSVLGDHGIKWGQDKTYRWLIKLQGEGLVVQRFSRNVDDRKSYWMAKK